MATLAQARAEHDRTKQALLDYFGLPKGSLPGTYSSYEAMLAAATKVAQQRGPPAKPVGRMPTGGHKSPAVVTRKARTRPATTKRTPAASKAAPATTQKQRERLTKLSDDIARAEKLVGGVEAMKSGDAKQREQMAALLREQAAAARARKDYAEARRLTLKAIAYDVSKIRKHG